jgi:glycosyltransferase involved in cell wall biosynthesis
LDEPLEAQESLNQHAVDITNQLARSGDFFICGNERQRDYWMGVLTSNGRINPRNFQQDPSLRSLIDVVGIGFPARPLAARPFLKGIHPQVPEDARIVLWGGGIWNWLDPLTLVKAWPRVVARHPKARLVFLGTRHPNPLVPAHEMARRTLDMAAEIGEKERSILFIEWVPYQDREALLSEADIGVSLHLIHVETRYSQRTRVLDYLWARLPVLVTEGDVTSEWVREHDLGVVAPPQDVEAVAEGLCRLLDEPKKARAASFDPLHAEYAWPHVVEPLLRYCLEGEHAADLQGKTAAGRAGQKAGSLQAQAGQQSWMWRRFLFILRKEGWRVVLHRAWRYLQWRLSTGR